MLQNFLQLRYSDRYSVIKRHSHIELSVISIAVERDALPPNDTAQG